MNTYLMRSDPSQVSCMHNRCRRADVVAPICVTSAHLLCLCSQEMLVSGVEGHNEDMAWALNCTGYSAT